MDVQLFSLSCISLVLAGAAAFVWAWGLLMSRRGRLPPGPRGLPILGHLHMLGSLPHQTLAQLSQRYGPLMSLRLGSVPLLVVSSPDTAKLVLHTHDKIFSCRPQNMTVIQNAFHALDIVFSQPGPYWKLMRQLCVTELFSTKRLDYFRYMRQEEVQGLILSTFAAQGTPISIGEKVLTPIANLISRMTLGARLQELGSASKGLPTLHALFQMMGLMNVSDCIPWLAWMDLQGLGRRSRKAALIANAMFQEVIDIRRQSGGGRSPNDPPRDFLDVLLIASLDSKHGVEDEHIRAVMMDMFVGGVHTSATVIECALAELLVNPEKLMILQREMEQVVGCSRLLQEADLPHLPYLQAVVNESLRLHPITPFLLPRMLMEPCQIFNYHIPKNTHVHVNTWAIHRDPNIWTNPLDFCPERFLDSNIDVLSQQCKFLPFGAGRRICPGWKLGLITVQILLGSLIHAFNWETLSKPCMEEKLGLALALKNSLIAVPMPKVPNCLFEMISKTNTLES